MNGPVELHEKDIRDDGRRSSKGNQLKWQKDEFWYKADYCGYEGLAEYLVSELLKHSTLPADMFVGYETVEIRYRQSMFRGCVSKDFLRPGDQLITLERLFMNAYHQSLTESIFRIADHKERLRFLTDRVTALTGIKEFGTYICILMTIDALILNEDRHMHNIALILDRNGQYHLSPVFDHGAALLSDLSLDYPLAMNVYDAIDSVQAKTFSTDFEEQLTLSEELYGDPIHFSYTERDLKNILAQEHYYPEEYKRRCFDVLMDRGIKYNYLFQKIL